jgi:xylan 1,4-beta-xylosidase
MKILMILILSQLISINLQAQISQTETYEPNRADQVIQEKQPIADQGNGYYRNPIFAGNYGDPSIVRVESDYYMAFSRGNGFMIWHSRDLVNWRPIIRQNFPVGFNMVWAVDLQYFDGKFYLYLPINEYPGKNTVGFGNFVTIAENPEGPWSDLVNLEIEPPHSRYAGIDPGFIETPQGEKYLYVNHGYVLQLNDDGTKAITTPRKVYDGWAYPEEWNVQCMCLESPKLLYKDGFYYMVSAQGGTAGPSTAHMSVVACSETPVGPWENSPYNPLTKTYDIEETWWHQGHGTILEAADGSWWTVYHGRLKNYTEIGRQTLLMPIEWTDDGWPVAKASYPSWGLIPMPHGENVGHGMAFSDDFTSDTPGIQWAIPSGSEGNMSFVNNKLIMKATGSGHREGNVISLGANNVSFEVTVKVYIPADGAWGGLSLGNDGVMTNGRTSTFTEGPVWRMRDVDIPNKTEDEVWLKIRNYRKDLSFFYSFDGENWKSYGRGLRTNDSYQIRLFAWGKGEVIFRNFRYQGLE